MSQRRFEQRSVPPADSFDAAHPDEWSLVWIEVDRFGFSMGRVSESVVFEAEQNGAIVRRYKPGQTC